MREWRFVDSFPRRKEMQTNVTKTRPRIFAIALKGYVELRTSPTPPKPESSEIQKEIETREMDYDAFYRNRYHWEDEFIHGRATRDQCPITVPCKVEKRKYKLKVISHDGGKVIDVMKIAKFRRLTSLSIRYGQCIEIPWNIGRIFIKGSIHHYGNRGDNARNEQDIQEAPEEEANLIEEVR